MSVLSVHHPRFCRAKRECMMSLEACEQRVPVFCPPYCFQSACLEYEQAALEALTNTVRSLLQQDVPIRTSEHVAHPARAYDIIR